MTVLGWSFVCNHIMLCRCCRRPCVDRLYDNFGSICQISWSFEHNNPWQWIKVGIGMGYCNSTCFQARGPTVQKWMFLLFVHVEFIIRPSRDGPYCAAGGHPHRFPHNNFSSVYWIFTNLDHMIPMWKGKNPIYFGVIRSKVKVTYYKYNFWQQGRFRMITLVLYIGSLTNLATWFPCGRGRTLFILGSLPLYHLIIYIGGRILWCTHFLFKGVIHFSLRNNKVTVSFSL